ncbi:MAG: L,D-transpeptidase family protein [Ferruginibacter sp.]
MKNFLSLLSVILFYGCNTQQQTDKVESNKVQQGTINRTDTVYVTRNAGITPANSYSDLFVDPMAVDLFIKTHNLSEGEEKNLRSFYNYRNYQFAWFTSLGFTEEAKGFWNLQDELEYKAEKSLRNKMDTLLNQDTLSISRFDTGIIKMELALTYEYLKFYSANREKTQFSDMSPEKVLPVKKENTLVLADTILHRRLDTSGHKTNAPYLALQQKLQSYLTIAKDGGWAPVSLTSKKIKKGSASPGVTLLKKRLLITREFSGLDTTAIFNDSLLMAIKNYQLHNGLVPTGLITDTLIRSLNVNVEKRIQQIIINLKRVQWLPVSTAVNYIAVNIPDFTLSVFENNQKSFDIPVAVGKEGTNTTIFSGKLNQVVFSPYWNIPASIVKREILPKIKADPNYLKSRHMEIVGKNDSLPVIRQLPGLDNALGKVKFLFPNRYDIYFHDSYAKDIFSRDKRAVSHGCIRLADAEKLANYLLRNNPSWTPEKVNAAMNSGKEQFVALTPAMHVSITYYTAWVDEAGQLNFRDDIYANDNKIAQMMFSNYSPANIVGLKDSLQKK